MSAALVLSVALIAVVWGLLVYQRRVDARRIETFRLLASASMSGGHAEPRQPDITYAAKGFTHVMVMRRTKSEFDLEAQAMGNGQLFLKDGASMSQALSAQWGGLCAINAEEALYQDAMDAYVATKREMGMSGEDGATKYAAASALLVGTQLALHPDEYERFLRHVGH